MIILDTNIISELMKTSPSTKVIAWLDQQDSLQLYITTITIAEISYGLHALPQGNRRDLLEQAFDKTMREAFKQRALSFDESAAHFYGDLMGRNKESGHPMSILDGQIAAIARAQDFSLATRNIKDFQNCGLVLINPFS